MAGRASQRMSEYVPLSSQLALILSTTCELLLSLLLLTVFLSIEMVKQIRLGKMRLDLFCVETGAGESDDAG